MQLESLGAWLRFAGLVESSRNTVSLSDLGILVHAHDPRLADPATWWIIHWNLARNYVVWHILSQLAYVVHRVEDIDAALMELAPGRSARTIRNARIALVKTLEQTPLGSELGIVSLEVEGGRVTGLEKLRVRHHGDAPMVVVAYALLDWAKGEQLGSAALESLAAPGGPGPILHMSEGALERYLIEVDGAFRGRVLSYSRTAGLNEAYFKTGVTPLQVLASHYLREREGVEWLEALERAQEEVEGEVGSE